MRRELETAIERAAVEFNSFWAAAQKTTTLAIQGWKVLNDVIGEGDGGRRVVVNANQTAPF
jgi:hypothetical protein